MLKGTQAISPKRTKYRKAQKAAGRRGQGQRGGVRRLRFTGRGAGWITSRQIEAARIAITRHIKRGGKVYIRVFPDKPTTKSRRDPNG